MRHRVIDVRIADGVRSCEKTSLFSGKVAAVALQPGTSFLLAAPGSMRNAGPFATV